MITKFQLYENQNGFDIYQDLLDLCDILMNYENKIETDFGSKTRSGLYNIIKSNPAFTVANALMNHNDTITTSFGDKSLEGIKNMILNVYDYRREQRTKDFNL